MLSTLQIPDSGGTPKQTTGAGGGLHPCGDSRGDPDHASVRTEHRRCVQLLERSGLHATGGSVGVSGRLSFKAKLKAEQDLIKILYLICTNLPNLTVGTGGEKYQEVGEKQKPVNRPHHMQSKSI